MWKKLSLSLVTVKTSCSGPAQTSEVGFFMEIALLGEYKKIWKVEFTFLSLKPLIEKMKQPLPLSKGMGLKLYIPFFFF